MKVMNEETWKKILSEIKSTSISVASLLSSAKLLDFNGDSLKLGVYYKFHKDKLEENRNRKIMEEAMQRVLAKDIKYECVLAEAPVKLELTDNENKNIMTAAEEIFS
jgi:hypothetical protein